MRALQGMSKPLDEFNIQLTKDSGLITTVPQDQHKQAADQTAEASQSNPPDQTNPTPTDNTNEPNKTSEPTTTSVQATPEQITLYGWRKGVSVKGVPMLMRYPCSLDASPVTFLLKSFDNRIAYRS